MKRNLFVILIIMIMCFISSGCNNYIEYDDSDLLKNVTMTIKDGTLTKTGATVIITDLSGDDNIYGDFFRIDKKENNKWKELEVVGDGYSGVDHMIGYSVNDDNILEMDINWEWLYGKLTTGDYRLVKDAAVKKNDNDMYTSTKYVYVEFNIE